MRTLEENIVRWENSLQNYNVNVGIARTDCGMNAGKWKKNGRYGIFNYEMHRSMEPGRTGGLPLQARSRHRQIPEKMRTMIPIESDAWDGDAGYAGWCCNPNISIEHKLSFQMARWEKWMKIHTTAFTSLVARFAIRAVPYSTSWLVSPRSAFTATWI